MWTGHNKDPFTQSVSVGFSISSAVSMGYYCIFVGPFTQSISVSGNTNARMDAKPTDDAQKALREWSCNKCIVITHRSGTTSADALCEQVVSRVTQPINFSNSKSIDAWWWKHVNAPIVARPYMTNDLLKIAFDSYQLFGINSCYFKRLTAMENHLTICDHFPVIFAFCALQINMQGYSYNNVVSVSCESSRILTYHTYFGKMKGYSVILYKICEDSWGLIWIVQPWTESLKNHEKQESWESLENQWEMPRIMKLSCENFLRIAQN